MNGKKSFPWPCKKMCLDAIAKKGSHLSDHKKTRLTSSCPAEDNKFLLEFFVKQVDAKNTKSSKLWLRGVNVNDCGGLCMNLSTATFESKSSII